MSSKPIKQCSHGSCVVHMNYWLGTLGVNLVTWNFCSLPRAGLKGNILTPGHDQKFQVQANSKNFESLQLLLSVGYNMHVINSPDSIYGCLLTLFNLSKKAGVHAMFDNSPGPPPPFQRMVISFVDVP